jgi:hypothetical protein
MFPLGKWMEVYGSLLSLTTQSPLSAFQRSFILMQVPPWGVKVGQILRVYNITIIDLDLYF